MERIARPLGQGAPRAGAPLVLEDGAEFAIFSRHGDSVQVCLFDADGGGEIERWRLAGRDGDIHHGFVPGVGAGARYGLRVDGPYDPALGHCFDPAKLLVDPRATRVDRAFVFRPEIALPRGHAVDTAPFVPRGIVEGPASSIPATGVRATPRFIYEIAVKAFTKSHPDVAAPLRGTLAGLASPRVIERLVALGVSHVELMPVTASMSERHLVELGLENAWGYNPAVFTALDPRLAPGGLDDLRTVVDALRAADIGVLLDVVFNHTAEGDAFGPTLNLRGLDNSVYYRFDGATPPNLINDTGCGNTLACHRAPVVDLIVDSLRCFVERAGVDGFRFDLAATLARDDRGFPEAHPLLAAIAGDEPLRDRVLIAEPWDVGPGGYRLGAFAPGWLEWNDRYRDGVRRFWRGDRGAIGDFATRLSGSADIFAASRTAPSASVNFVAAHDGFSLRDLVSNAQKHNEANGEDNRDGTNDNLSWNRGPEGATTDVKIESARGRDVRALLACLFLSRGTPMLTAGDEFGRSQKGNNNAYAQDNATTWLAWETADRDLAAYVAGLSRLRRELAPLHDDRFLTGEGDPWPDVAWTNASGAPMTDLDWADADVLCMTLFARADRDVAGGRLLLVFNRAEFPSDFEPPAPRSGCAWSQALDSSTGFVDAGARAVCVEGARFRAPARSVVAYGDWRPREELTPDAHSTAVTGSLEGSAAGVSERPRERRRN